MTEQREQMKIGLLVLVLCCLPMIPGIVACVGAGETAHAALQEAAQAGFVEVGSSDCTSCKYDGAGMCIETRHLPEGLFTVEEHLPEGGTVVRMNHPEPNFRYALAGLRDMPEGEEIHQLNFDEFRL